MTLFPTLGKGEECCPVCLGSGRYKSPGPTSRDFGGFLACKTCGGWGKVAQSSGSNAIDLNLLQTALEKAEEEHKKKTGR